MTKKCECGHKKFIHNVITGNCKKCPCKKFKIK